MPDKEWGYPDGGKFTEHEDGSYTVTDANGAKTHVDPATGKKTETPPNPPGGQPTETNPNPGYPKDDGQEIEIRFADGTRVYIRKNPKRFRIVRSLGRPRKWEVDLPAGTRRIQEVKDGETVQTPPTEGSPREITPSEHPKPPETPGESTPGTTPGGSSSGGSKSGTPKKKGGSKKRPLKARPRRAAPKRKRNKKAARPRR